jgi:hypothetical protein
MKITNVSPGALVVSDISGGQSGQALVLPLGSTITIFNQQAQESLQLAAYITAGLVVVVNSDEPTTGTSVANADAAAIPLAGDLSGTPLTASVDRIRGVALLGTPTAGQVLTAISGVAAAWQAPSGGGGGGQWTTTGNDIYYSTGNVGVGTASPLFVFQTFSASNGAVGISGVAPGIQMSNVANFSGMSQYAFFGMATSSGQYFPDASAGDLCINSGRDVIFGVNGLPPTVPTESFRIVASGKVGIGTATPRQALEIAGNLAQGDFTTAGSTFVGRVGSGGLFSSMNGGSSGLEIESTNLGGSFSQKLHLMTHSFGISSGRRLTVDENGNVGIGTDTPAYLLDVAGSVNIGGNLTATGLINLGAGNISNGDSSTVIGIGNTSSGRASFAAGEGNSATAHNAIAGGGETNTASGDDSFIAGGSHNTNSGFAGFSSGILCAASGYNSFASGFKAKANHTNAFVWGDSTDANFSSTADNQFLIRATGGVGIGTGAPAYALDVTGDINTTGTFRINGSPISGGGVGGSGTPTVIPIWNGASSLANSPIQADTSAPSVYFFGTSASGAYSFCLGYPTNSVSGPYSAIIGGADSNVSGSASFACGYKHTVSGSNSFAACAQNIVSGDVAFAAGWSARAVHQGAFVWADSQGYGGTLTPFSSTANDQFLIRASGGVGIGTNSPAKMLDVAGSAQFGSGKFILDASVAADLEIADYTNGAFLGVSGPGSYIAMGNGAGPSFQIALDRQYLNSLNIVTNGGAGNGKGVIFDYATGNVGVGGFASAPASALHVTSDSVTTGETGVTVDIPGIGTRRILVGAADSAGSGFRTLMVAN